MGIEKHTISIHVFFLSCEQRGPESLSLLKFLFFLCSNQTVILVLFSVLFCNILFYICNTVIILFFSISLFFFILVIQGDPKNLEKFFFYLLASSLFFEF